MTASARLYGGSLYDLALQETLTEDMMQQLVTVRDIFLENPDYVKLLQEPSIPIGERIGLIDAAFGQQAHKYLLNFMKLLCERNLLGEFGMCCREYIRRYNADHKIAEATVTSAVRLSEEQMNALKEKLEKISGKKICLNQIQDASVIGGLKVELEGTQMDGTVQGRLSGISRKLENVVV